MSTEPIAPSSRLVRREMPFASRVQGEIVMMSLETNNYYGLGQVGSRIWDLLAEPVTFDALCLQLQQEYQVEPEVCQQEVREFLATLLQEQLVVRVP